MAKLHLAKLWNDESALRWPTDVAPCLEASLSMQMQAKAARVISWNQQVLEDALLKCQQCETMIRKVTLESQKWCIEQYVQFLMPLQPLKWTDLHQSRGKLLRSLLRNPALPPMLLPPILTHFSDLGVNATDEVGVLVTQAAVANCTVVAAPSVEPKTPFVTFSIAELLAKDFISLFCEFDETAQKSGFDSKNENQNFLEVRQSQKSRILTFQSRWLQILKRRLERSDAVSVLADFFVATWQASATWRIRSAAADLVLSLREATRTNSWAMLTETGAIAVLNVLLDAENADKNDKNAKTEADLVILTQLKRRLIDDLKETIRAAIHLCVCSCVLTVGSKWRADECFCCLLDSESIGGGLKCPRLTQIATARRLVANCVAGVGHNELTDELELLGIELVQEATKSVTGTESAAHRTALCRQRFWKDTGIVI